MKRPHHLLATGVALVATALAQPVRAAGTLAGTLIQNTATATFSTGSGVMTLHSNTNTVKVDQLIGVAVTGLISTPVPIGASTAVLSYQVTNTGNGADSFDLGGTTNVAGNAFAASLQAVAIDTNGNGVYDPGVDMVIANGSAGQAIAPDGTMRVFLIVAAPSGVTDLQTAQVRLTATSVI